MKNKKSSIKMYNELKDIFKYRKQQRKYNFVQCNMERQNIKNNNHITDIETIETIVISCEQLSHFNHSMTN